MDSFVLILIATFALTTIKADDEGVIEVYEIRKSDDVADNLRFDEADDRIDAQYYDPDYPERVDYKTSKSRISRNDRNIDIITNNLLDKLKRLVKSNYAANRDDDYIASYSNLKDDVLEQDKQPLFIVADKNLIYHVNPKKSKSLQNKWQSVLRSINIDNEVEDRTAPPRVRVYFDYDYD